MSMMLLNILILINSATVGFLSVLFLMININTTSLDLTNEHRENGKKALLTTIIFYALFIIFLFIYKGYRKKRKLCNNLFMKKRNSPKYVQLQSTYYSTSDEYEQYELNKI
ncbi:conserved protein, unknown function [Hepatocystis sp. ex Piliocolobus tephrosceles]|nr:conserved protein, unknown function [Hepatocystis sp. ex Piliocolobus tephrosceles]